MKTAINSLHLVYPPMSNQEGEWFKQDAEVREMLRRSNIYMIAQRQEAKFRWEKPPMTAAGIPFTLEIPGVAIGSGLFPIEADFKDGREVVDFEFGDKFIRASVGGTPEAVGDVLWWYTSEALLFSRWRGDRRIKGLNNFRDFTTYHLLYVGLSTSKDSYERLLAKGHHKRVAILSNETQVVPEARLTDEIYLFFFESNPLFVHVFDEFSDVSSFGMGTPFTEGQASADAEKAFTKFLNTRYNDIKFMSFPKGKNGLYDVGLSHYAHVIDEDITFTTQTAIFHGGYGHGLPCSNDADAIMVTGDEARIYTAAEIEQGDRGLIF